MSNNTQMAGHVILGDYAILAGMCAICLLYTSPSPRDRTRSRMPSSAWKKNKKTQHKQKNKKESKENKETYQQKYNSVIIESESTNVNYTTYSTL